MATRQEAAVVLMSPAAGPRSWSIWRAPVPVIALVLCVYAGAMGAASGAPSITSGSLARFIALAVAGSICLSLCVRMERARKFLEAGSVPNLSAVWTFAGALCLDHLLAIALVVVVYSVQWFSQKSLYVGKVHRYVFGAATVVIGVRISELAGDPLLAGLLFLAANLVPVAAAMIASGNARAVRRMADPREQGFEILTLVLGLVTAGLVETHLALVFVVVPVVIALNYFSLCRHVRRPSTMDQNSGVLTTRAWHALANLRLAHVSEAIVFQVLVADGPERSVRELAQILGGAVREEDLIGRTTDGFSILVAAPGGALLAEMLGLQIQARFAAEGIKTYVGSAATPDRGGSVDLQDLAVAAHAEVIVQASDVEGIERPRF